jgi:hypothetical protein
MPRHKNPSLMPRFQTTDPGYKNKHGQIVISRTGFPSESFPGQTIYHLRCDPCGHDYGSNGSDIHKRHCPRCQNGSKGEPLREPAPSLFSMESV